MAKKTVAFGKTDALTDVCFISDPKLPRDYMGKSRCRPEDKYSKRVGQRLSYYRAMQDYAKGKSQYLDKQIKTLIDYQTFIFPKKFKGSMVDALRERSERYIKKLVTESILWKSAINDYKVAEKEYLKGLKDISTKIKNKDSD